VLYHVLAPFGIHVRLVEPGCGRGTNFETAALALNGENSIPVSYQPQLGRLMGDLPQSQRTSKMLPKRYSGRSTTLAQLSDFPAGADSVVSAARRAALSEEAFLAMSRQAFGVPQQ
jgi:hypothetical protein